MKLRKEVCVVGLGLLLSGSLILANTLPEVYSRVAGPRGDLRFARPTLRWEVWTTPGSSVTSATMRINGKLVEAEYKKEEKALLFVPSAPLPPGEHLVEASVVIDRRFTAKKTWNVKIAGDAVPELPAPSSEQLRVLRAANKIRKELGLPEFQPDQRLFAAANAHSDYLAQNKTAGHFQRPGLPGFIGETPGDRLEAFGWIDGSWENVDSGSPTPEDAVRNLMEAPYHRLPFMQPGEPFFGAGAAGRRTTIEFGMTYETQTVVSPAPNQKDVPPAWSYQERPDPLRLHHGARRPVGYVIVFAHFTPEGDKIRVHAATLRKVNGEEVPRYLNTPENDDQLRFACFLIPKRALDPHTTYEAAVNATSANGDKISRTWRFTTGAGKTGRSLAGDAAWTSSTIRRIE
jgi:hypothetical protein